MVWGEVGCPGGSEVESILSKACMMLDPIGVGRGRSSKGWANCSNVIESECSRYILVGYRRLCLSGWFR